MRPALAALYEQQKIIDQLAGQNTELLRAVSALLRADQQKTAQIKQLSRGLAAVSRLTGNEQQVRTAIFKRADEQNPAQPIPDPAGEPPTQSSAEAEAPEAFADVRAPGLVPGTNNDTASDAVTTTYTPGGDLPSPAINQLVDVTRPIDGTQGPRPLSETKTLTDVRVGDPMNAQVAYPVNGPFANAQRTSSAEGSNSRAVASLRLAKLRIATGTAETDDETVLMDSIVRDASLSDDMIAREVETLGKVAKTSARQVEAPRNVVPRSAVQRTVPQMRTAASVNREMDAEDLFLASEF
jgi:hypothetical protein